MKNAIRNITLLTLLTLMCFIYSGPAIAEAAKAYPGSVSQLVSQAKKSIKPISLAAFKAAYDARDYDIIVDVREPGEFRSGYIPGAVNIPRGVIEFKIWPYVGFPEKTNTSKKIILYCKTGGRCALAAKSLQDLGFSNVRAADIKFSAWVKAGYPTISDN